MPRTIPCNVHNMLGPGGFNFLYNCRDEAVQGEWTSGILTRESDGISGSTRLDLCLDCRRLPRVMPRIAPVEVLSVATADATPGNEHLSRLDRREGYL